MLSLFDVFKCCLRFFLSPGSNVHCIYGFFLPKTRVNTLTINLAKKLMKNPGGSCGPSSNLERAF